MNPAGHARPEELDPDPAIKEHAPLPAAIRSFPARSDGGPGRDGAIGLVALATDHVCELDLRQIIPQDRLPLYACRIGFAPAITVETLAAMCDGIITAAAALILAGGRLDVIAYGCTSGTMVIGEDEVFARLRAARHRLHDAADRQAMAWHALRLAGHAAPIASFGRLLRV